MINPVVNLHVAHGAKNTPPYVLMTSPMILVMTKDIPSPLVPTLHAMEQFYYVKNVHNSTQIMQDLVRLVDVLLNTSGYVTP